MKPPINQMGIDKAKERNLLNDAVRAQLELVKENVEHYLPHHRAFGHGGLNDLMPHEWGSLDTYDDMRNSLWLAAALMNDLLAAEEFADQQEHIRRLLNEYGNPCAVHPDVLVAAGIDTESVDWWEQLDKEFEREN